MQVSTHPAGLGSLPARLSLSMASAERHRRHPVMGSDPTPGARTRPKPIRWVGLSYSGAPSHAPTHRPYGGSAGMQTDVPKIIQRLPNGRSPPRPSPRAPEHHQNGLQAPFEPWVIPIGLARPASSIEGRA